jgi:hypothetical protein
VDLSGLLFSTSDDGFYEAKNRTDGPGDQSNRTDVPVTDDGVPGRNLQRQLTESSMVRRIRCRDSGFLLCYAYCNFCSQIPPFIFHRWYHTHLALPAIGIILD